MKSLGKAVLNPKWVHQTKVCQYSMLAVQYPRAAIKSLSLLSNFPLQRQNSGSPVVKADNEVGSITSDVGTSASILNPIDYHIMSDYTLNFLFDSLLILEEELDEDVDINYSVRTSQNLIGISFMLLIIF